MALMERTEFLTGPSSDANSTDETRLLEMEKLQRLVQTLQEENKQLLANEGKKGQQESIEPARDSGIDSSTSCSDEIEEDIIDLDRFDLADDEESWLYSTPSSKKQGDILSWLRKDIYSLNPAARRALATKLELLIAKKNAASKSIINDGLVGILDFDDDGVLQIQNDGSTRDSDSRRWGNRQSTAKIDRNTQSKSQWVNSATYVKPKKMTKPSSNSITPNENGDQQDGSSAALYQNCESDGTNRSRTSTVGSVHLELNPDMQDIQFLASQQEEELRRCLHSLQQMNRRKQVAGNQKDIESGVKAVIPANPSDRFATYTRPKNQALANGPGKPAAVASRKAPSLAETGGVLQVPSSTSAGLQKSLPNLSGNKPEMPPPSFAVDTKSEKGSYGDIPATLNTPRRSQAPTSSAPRLLGSTSKLPTPARGRLSTPAKTSIPLPRSSTYLATSASSTHRAKSPVGKRQSVATSKMQPAKESWREGCF